MKKLIKTRVPFEIFFIVLSLICLITFSNSRFTDIWFGFVLGMSSFGLVDSILEIKESKKSSSEIKK